MPEIDRWLVVLDWSGQSLDAMLTDPSGDVHDRLQLALALRAVEPGVHERHVTALTAPWRAKLGPLRIVATGMIGGRGGWAEVPYVPTPAGPAELAAAARRFTTDSCDEVIVIPGLSCRHALPFPDVMRGEEVQIVGADLAQTRRIVLPGGHTKWVESDGAKVLRFQTFVTGELVAAMRRSGTTLSPARPSGHRDWEAFEAGLKAGRSGSGENGLLARLFCARTGWLAGAVSDTGLGDYFSGIAISSELEETAKLGWHSGGDRVGIVGDGDDVEAYSRALTAFDVLPVVARPEAIARGAARILAALNDTASSNGKKR